VHNSCGGDADVDKYYDNEYYGFENDAPHRAKVGKQHGNTPINNRAQNRQSDTIAKKYGIEGAGKEFLHQEVGKQGNGYKAIEQMVKESMDVFGKK
jgi:hypothetical protein